MKDDYDGHLFFRGLINGLILVTILYAAIYFLWTHQSIIQL